MRIVKVRVVNGSPDYAEGGGAGFYSETYPLDSEYLLAKYTGEAAIPTYTGQYPPPPPPKYETRGFDYPAFRKLYGTANAILADKVWAGIESDLSYLDGPIMIDPNNPDGIDGAAILVGYPQFTYRDLLRTSLGVIRSAPVIHCDNEEVIAGINLHYLVGILPSMDEVNRILRGMPI